MVVKVIKTKIDYTEKIVFNSDLTGYINVGNRYNVFGLEVYDEILYFIIFDDDHLLSVPSRMFETIESSIPRSWIPKYSDEGMFTLYPELFYTDFFFDRFSDYDDDLREKFEVLQNQYPKFIDNILSSSFCIVSIISESRGI